MSIACQALKVLTTLEEVIETEENYCILVLKIKY